jgi:hypothetical protein
MKVRESYFWRFIAITLSVLSFWGIFWRSARQIWRSVLDLQSALKNTGMWCDYLKFSRATSLEVNTITEFLKKWLNNNNNCQRTDYKELAKLALLYLGGYTEDNFTFVAPGACHHASWMARFICTLKITLLWKQLQPIYDDVTLKNVRSLALFRRLFT